ncbi:ANTAR domain-containing response regulator [Bacillus piscicola]|uniref:ANTAR domain-containing response regulator n=1 Tax=Bacillus piscicola TaxID=1632684 RepID=UPI001F0949F4|nr:response regulator [Bacillus piscicola]
MKSRILVVEDESIVRLDVSMMLKDAGYEVIGEAGDGEEAVEFVHHTQPDLLIMDIKMPKLDGLKASRIINKRFDIPILLLTAYSQRDFIEKAKEANIVGYIIKPVSEDRLIPAVEIALHQGKVAAEHRKKLEEASYKLEERKLVEKAKGLLMKRFSYTEETAFKKMRKLSMDRQVSLEKVARQVLKKYSSDPSKVDK